MKEGVKRFLKHKEHLSFALFSQYISLFHTCICSPIEGNAQQQLLEQLYINNTIMYVSAMVKVGYNYCNPSKT